MKLAKEKVIANVHLVGATASNNVLGAMVLEKENVEIVMVMEQLIIMTTLVVNTDILLAKIAMGQVKNGAIGVMVPAEMIVLNAAQAKWNVKIAKEKAKLNVMNVTEKQLSFVPTAKAKEKSNSSKFSCKIYYLFNEDYIKISRLCTGVRIVNISEILPALTWD